MKVASYKIKLTNEEIELEQSLDKLSHTERLEWKKNEVMRYYVGQPVRAVIGGYFGPWAYGRVTRIGEYHIAFETVPDNKGRCSTMVATPVPCSGIESITQDELEAAMRGDFLTNEKRPF